ncbi:N-acetyltransferase family protein [Phaeovulum sp.]|uniref:GNAT family N-acetyltransferase n=1 Tax=Phaeovulum sp. TaxID=2934796 RepID=UPI003566A883
MIRPAEPRDLARIMAFWNPMIRDTTVTFSSEEKTEAGLTEMIATRRAAGYEFLVAEEDGQVMGVATYAQFRGGNGYAHAMEHTIVLAPEAHGRGFGRALMSALEAHAKAAGCHVLVAGVSAENAAGLAFHASIGFVETGRMPETGRKFGRWLDLVLMQKTL